MSHLVDGEVTVQSVILSEAKNLFHARQRPFAALRVTNETERLHGENLHLIFEASLEFVFFHFKVVARLEIQPKTL